MSETYNQAARSSFSLYELPKQPMEKVVAALTPAGDQRILALVTHANGCPVMLSVLTESGEVLGDIRMTRLK